MQTIEIYIHDGKSENNAIVQVLVDNKKVAQFKFSSKEKIVIEQTGINKEKVTVTNV